MTEPSTEQEFLDAYNIHDFDVPLVSVDMTIFTIRDHQLQVLLVKRSEHPCRGRWALPGGFIDLARDQSLEQTARRKLKQKTGVDTPYLEQVATFGNAKRDPRGWSVTVTYLALLASEQIIMEPDSGSDEIDWVPVSGLPRRNKLAFDHQTILEACLDRLRKKVMYSSLPIHLLPEQFTLTELQQTFEIILGTPVEKKSFRRRIINADVLEETGAMRGGSNRPAKLYRLKAGSENHFFSRNLEGPRV